MVRYTIHLSGESSVSLEAAKVNTGQNWLWFYDAANHLIGLYYWRNILGFTVDGSASDQVITDRVPMDMGVIPREEYSRSTLLELEELERSGRGRTKRRKPDLEWRRVQSSSETGIRYLFCPGVQLQACPAESLR